MMIRMCTCQYTFWGYLILFGFPIPGLFSVPVSVEEEMIKIFSYKPSVGFWKSKRQCDSVESKRSLQFKNRFNLFGVLTPAKRKSRVLFYDVNQLNWIESLATICFKKKKKFFQAEAIRIYGR